MVAYNFQKRFADLVASGEKQQTIRAPRRGRSRHARSGETINLFTGLRTKQVRRLKEATCTGCYPIMIHRDSIHIGWPEGTKNLIASDADTFAQADGFESFDDMQRWFQKTHELPFLGVLIQWVPR